MFDLGQIKHTSDFTRGVFFVIIYSYAVDNRRSDFFCRFEFWQFFERPCLAHMAKYPYCARTFHVSGLPSSIKMVGKYSVV